MDTRSVIRSRRQSARLNGQPRGDKLQGLPPTTRAATPRHSSSSASTIKRAASSTKSSPTETPQPPTGTTKSSTKNGERVANSPMLPNLASTMTTRAGTRVTQKRKRSAEASKNTGTEGQGGRVGARCVKTAQEAMRSVDGGPRDTTGGKKISSKGTFNSNSTSLPDTRRRSARLSSITPGVEDMKTTVTDARYETAQASSPEHKGVACVASLQEGQAVESQHTPHRMPSAESSGSGLTDLDMLPPYDIPSFADFLADEADFAEKTSPIPELVADIARIMETSSPMASRDSPNVTPTKFAAVKTSATSALALEHARAADKPTEAVLKTKDSSSFAQSTTSDPLQSGVTSSGPSTRSTMSQHQGDNPRGVEGHAYEMSHDEQASMQQQQLDTQYQPLPVSAFTPTINLIENASSRDCYGTEDDGLDSPGGEHWLDGETGELGRASGLLGLGGDPFLAGFLSHADFSAETGTPEPSQHACSPSPPQTGPTHQAEQTSLQYEEHGPTASQPAADHSPRLRDVLKCGDCGRTPEAFLVCARCLETRYCGKYCQIWNWPIHRRLCDAAEEADPGEVKRLGEYLESMWAGAIRALEVKAVAGQGHGAGVGRGEQAIADRDIVEQGVGLLGAGQQGRSMSGGDERLGGPVTERGGDGAADEEEVTFSLPPPSPESMLQSRALSLRLAQGVED